MEGELPNTNRNAMTRKYVKYKAQSVIIRHIEHNECRLDIDQT